MVPFLLIYRALVDASDKEIFEKIVMANIHDTFLTDRIHLLLSSFRRYAIFSKDQCLGYLGSRFGVMLDSPDDLLDVEVGQELIRKVILVHLDDPRDKADLFMYILKCFLYNEIALWFKSFTP